MRINQGIKNKKTKIEEKFSEKKILKVIEDLWMEDVMTYNEKIELEHTFKKVFKRLKEQK